MPKTINRVSHPKTLKNEFSSCAIINVKAKKPKYKSTSIVIPQGVWEIMLKSFDRLPFKMAQNNTAIITIINEIKINLFISINTRLIINWITKKCDLNINEHRIINKMGNALSNKNTANTIRELKFQLSGWVILDKTDHSILLRKIAEEKCIESFREIFNYYSPKIYAFGLKGGLSEDLAKDLIQDVMTTIWTKSHLFNAEKGEAQTWIYTLSRNSRFDFFRKKSKENNFISSNDIWDLEDQSELEIDLEKLLSAAKLKESVQTLPQEQRDVVECLYYLGMTHEEVSNKFDIPLGTVKSRLRLAINKLSKVIKK